MSYILVLAFFSVGNVCGEEEVVFFLNFHHYQEARRSRTSVLDKICDTFIYAYNVLTYCDLYLGRLRLGETVQKRSSFIQ